ncbi:MAG: bifunctional hydroxymethylpyrimidine kinase/phosphomethylpyrimidine kinase [Oscillospiraceae bacterium]|jgi:hydroxymethylpyrimidine/phosphomethylpyrimidine kinase|nr:bifunctional hydroxymethylpyrimidine kinase/phosphomethylpyrimidine kinase [Oscillospiraceae bacterium]
MKPPIVLTIAGSDSSGGAGIQADLKTIAAHGCYGMSALTALTAQNTRCVTAIHVPPAAFLTQQLAAVLTDFPPDAVKIGMLPDADCVRAVASALRNVSAPIVLDPVMVATSGASLSEDSAVNAMIAELFPLAALITPNITEAECLSKLHISSEEDMLRAAKALPCPVLLKGGHLGCATDLLLADGREIWLRGEYLPCGETHGTGCTLSSAVACNLAMGHSMEESVRRAKLWLTDLLRRKPDFNVPNGPLQIYNARE